jgi:hypothetical protein
VNHSAALRAAVWVVAHLTYGERRESILGDLLERHAQGETAWWLLRQALYAVLIGLKKVIREYGLLFPLALTAASATVFAFGFVSPIISHKVSRLWLSVTRDALWSQHLYWRVAFPISIAQLCLGYALAAWIAVRIYRPHPRLVVCVLAAFHVASSMPWGIRLVQDLMTNARYLEGLLWYLDLTTVTTVTIIASGLWAANRRYGVTP